MSEYVVTTIKAREKFAKAHLGLAPLPIITKIAFGDGGHDTLGNPIKPSQDLTLVPGEFMKKDLDNTELFNPTTVRIKGSLNFEESIGTQVSAVGIYDSEGDLVAVKTFSPKNKDGDTRIEIEWDELF
ncbi:Phage tail-collar fibre protein [Desulfonispora thiosulfatigenes DSM 11270]|uniref:Phage tail-collar fibre protein n=1 Tax=Desulfonispora thiosulfatigenes DSM 11270 TaxID=656914 RepID=A0A1W1VPM6_DESTI|nr:phage tail protein [Desulfonispora thiosulfatigenes]SMB95309.1 Phage tail-collar fibre protein [Desulfonispora thiosulfatigenes DSM 11270]